jgi:TRAP-type C4-dicarboxylate transport system permease small subunit
MKPIRIIGLILIIAGILGLIYGGFSYTRKTHEAKLGSLDISVQEKKEVNVPGWAGAGAVILGGILFFMPARPS